MPRGSLEGKRVLDIACNCGFWSIQCALLGAKEVVGFDARPDLVERSNILKSIVGTKNVHFKVLDFWDMDSGELMGPFDIVLNLGLLYHLPDTVRALRLTKKMAGQLIVLDTEVFNSVSVLLNRVITRILNRRFALAKVGWDSGEGISNAAAPGVIFQPSTEGLELIFQTIGFKSWKKIPLRTMDMPNHYLTHRRESWLIQL